MLSNDIIVFIIGLISILIVALVLLYLLKNEYENQKLVISNGLLDQKLERNVKKIKPQTKGKKIRDLAFGSFLSFILLTLISFGFYAKTNDNIFPIGNQTVLVVKTNSMKYKNEHNVYLKTNNLDNQFEGLDLVGIEKVNVESLRQYDIIAYRYYDDIYVHRIISIKTNKDGVLEFKTRGDSNQYSDGYVLTEKDIIGKYTGYRIPYVGHIILFCQSPFGLLAFLILIGLFIGEPLYQNKLDRLKYYRLLQIGRISQDEFIKFYNLKPNEVLEISKIKDSKSQQNISSNNNEIVNVIEIRKEKPRKINSVTENLGKYCIALSLGIILLALLLILVKILDAKLNIVIAASLFGLIIVCLGILSIFLIRRVSSLKHFKVYFPILTILILLSISLYAVALLFPLDKTIFNEQLILLLTISLFMVIYTVIAISSSILLFANSNETISHNPSKNIESKEIAKIQCSVLRSVADVIEAKDLQTGSHSKSVSKIVEKIALSLSETNKYKDILTKEYVKTLKDCAPLHDLGKIFIPDSILLKKGTLTPEEKELMDCHTTKGKDFIIHSLSNIENKEYLTTASDMAYYHHEWYNGNGYPTSIRGENIPLSARIMAVADVYDVLRMKRSYKNAMTKEEAIEIIKNESGTHFDPDIVEAFLKIVDKLD